MRTKIHGDKKDVVAVAFRNVEATVTVKQGAPVFYKAAGTKFGFDCISIENLAAGSQFLFAGISFAEVAPNKMGEAFNFGLFDGLRYILISRSGTGAIWPSYPSRAVGDLLGFESNSNTTDHVQAAKYVGNTVLASAASVASYASNVSIPSVAAIAGVDNLAFEWSARLAQSIASSDTVASNSDAADAAKLFRTTTIKAIIRAL